jgi:caffeoyl-CoA O-methyltransferase
VAGGRREPGDGRGVRDPVAAMTPLSLDPDIERYILDHTTPAGELMDRLQRETQEKLPAPQMLSGVVEGRLLQALVHISRAKLVLELGTYSGYSALMMAAALPAGGRVITCEVSPEFAEFARGWIDESEHGQKVEIRLGPALETISELEGPFDLVFIDADKPGYRDYYEATLPKLAPHGLIAADNTLWGGRVADPSDQEEMTRGMREFNDHVRDDPRVVSTILSVRDGITLIRPV